MKVRTEEMPKSQSVDGAPPAERRPIWASRRLLVTLAVMMPLLFAWVVWNAGKRELRLLHNSVPFTTAEVIFLDYARPQTTGRLNLPALRVSPHAWTVHPDADGLVRLRWRSPFKGPAVGTLLIITNPAPVAMTEFQWNEDLRELDLIDTGWRETTRFRFFGLPIGTKTTVFSMPVHASQPSR